jgi:ankyrin repeat protein
VSHNNSQLVRYLIEELKSKTDLKDFRDRTPLHLALHNAKSDQTILPIALYLIKNGASINNIDAFGRTPVHYLFAEMEYALSSHRNRYSRNSSNEPIEQLTDFGNVDDCKLNVKDVYGRAPLHYRYDIYIYMLTIS